MFHVSIIKAKTPEEVGSKAADFFEELFRRKPACLIGLATGSTPLGIYRQLIRWYEKGDLDFADVTTVNLDEYCGLPPSDRRSYHYFMQHNFFSGINVAPERIYLPDGLAGDSRRECARYDGIIARVGGIDLQLLGLGRNSHIGFNEPDDHFSRGTHQVALTESTIAANTRFFEREEDVPRRAYTMGIKSIMQSRKILVVASGADKAEIVRDAFTGPVTPQVPASILQLHGDVILVGDQDALSLL